MTPTLTSFLLRSHGGPAWPNAGTPIEWSPDHVLLDDADGTVAALAFEATGATRVACELVLIAPQRESSGPDGVADLRFLQSFASKFGAHFARPGAGAVGRARTPRTWRAWPDSATGSPGST